MTLLRERDHLCQKRNGFCDVVKDAQRNACIESLNQPAGQEIAFHEIAAVFHAVLASPFLGQFEHLIRKIDSDHTPGAAFDKDNAVPSGTASDIQNGWRLESLQFPHGLLASFIQAFSEEVIEPADCTRIIFVESIEGRSGAVKIASYTHELPGLSSIPQSS